MKYAIPPIGACLLLALVLLIWKRPKHLLVWCIVPFFVAHAFIPHKELRSSFLLGGLVAPLLLVLGFVEWRMLFNGDKWHTIGKLALGILIFTNLLGLSVVLTSPAGIGRTVLAKALHAMQPQPGSHITYADRAHAKLADQPSCVLLAHEHDGQCIHDGKLRRWKFEHRFPCGPCCRCSMLS